MTVAKYKIYYKGDRKAELYKNSQCFANYTYSDDPQETTGVVYYPSAGRSKLVSAKLAKEYYGVLLASFNMKEYLDGYPTALSIAQKGLHISAELPTSTALFILTMFRYVEEIPQIVTTFMTLREMGDSMTDIQYMEWAHKIASIGPYGFNVNHSIFSNEVHQFCKGNALEVFLNDWDANLPHNDPEKRTTLLNEVYNSDCQGADAGLIALEDNRTEAGTNLQSIVFMNDVIRRKNEIKAEQERAA